MVLGMIGARTERGETVILLLSGLSVVKHIAP